MDATNLDVDTDDDKGLVLKNVYYDLTRSGRALAEGVAPQEDICGPYGGLPTLDSVSD